MKSVLLFTRWRRQRLRRGLSLPLSPGERVILTQHLIVSNLRGSFNLLSRSIVQETPGIGAGRALNSLGVELRNSHNRSCPLAIEGNATF